MNRCDYLDPGLAWTGVKDTGRGATLSRIGYEMLTRPKSYPPEESLTTMQLRAQLELSDRRAVRRRAASASSAEAVKARRHQQPAVRHRSGARQDADDRGGDATALAAAGSAAQMFSDVQAQSGRGQCRRPASRPSRRGGHDGVVAFGGGSALDAGKLIAFMAGQTRPMWDFEDVGDWWTRADAERHRADRRGADHGRHRLGGRPRRRSSPTRRPTPRRSSSIR